jgi:hypothetical protein
MNLNDEKTLERLLTFLDRSMKGSNEDGAISLKEVVKDCGYDYKGLNMGRLLTHAKAVDIFNAAYAQATHVFLEKVRLYVLDNRVPEYIKEEFKIAMHLSRLDGCDPYEAVRTYAKMYDEKHRAVGASLRFLRGHLGLTPNEIFNKDFETPSRGIKEALEFLRRAYRENRLLPDDRPIVRIVRKDPVPCEPVAAPVVKKLSEPAEALEVVEFPARVKYSGDYSTSGIWKPVLELQAHENGPLPLKTDIWNLEHVHLGRIECEGWSSSSTYGMVFADTHLSPEIGETLWRCGHVFWPDYWGRKIWRSKVTDCFRDRRAIKDVLRSFTQKTTLPSRLYLHNGEVMYWTAEYDPDGVECSLETHDQRLGQIPEQFTGLTAIGGDTPINIVLFYPKCRYLDEQVGVAHEQWRRHNCQAHGIVRVETGVLIGYCMKCYPFIPFYGERCSNQFLRHRVGSVSLGCITAARMVHEFDGLPYKRNDDTFGVVRHDRNVAPLPAGTMGQLILKLLCAWAKIDGADLFIVHGGEAGPYINLVDDPTWEYDPIRGTDLRMRHPNKLDPPSGWKYVPELGAMVEDVWSPHPKGAKRKPEHRERYQREFTLCNFSHLGSDIWEIRSATLEDPLAADYCRGPTTPGRYREEVLDGFDTSWCTLHHDPEGLEMCEVDPSFGKCGRDIEVDDPDDDDEGLRCHRSCYHYSGSDGTPGWAHTQ